MHETLEGETYTLTQAQAEGFGQVDVVLAKVGTNSLTEDGDQISDVRIGWVASDLLTIRHGHNSWRPESARVGFVTSAAVNAGMESRDYALRPDQSQTAELQFLAASGMIRLFSIWQQELGEDITMLLPTRNNLKQPSERADSMALIEKTLLHDAIFGANENPLATTELPHEDEQGEYRFDDNDMLSAILAVCVARLAIVNSVHLVLLTNKNGLLEDIKRDDSRIERIYTADIEAAMHASGGKGVSSHNGSGGMDGKVDAAKYATNNGVNTYIGPANFEHGLLKTLQGEMGTLVLPSTAEVIAAEQTADHS